MEEQITKFSAPTTLDKADYGKVWAENFDGENRYFIQLGENAEDPDWRPLGKFFEKCFEDLVADEPFMKECIRLYQYHVERPYKRISDIIKDK